ncbi:MAG: DUF423 domain-containing protein [Bacteroidia bacterium]|nr:DUF423 domain-containing protein [Bacteroidia bacterium]
MSNRKFLIAASVLGALAVVLGAFGAHGLKNILTPYQLEIWNKGVFYQFIHVFAIFISGFLNIHYPGKAFRYALLFFLGGILCFSGSLYFLALRDSIPLPVALLGPVTPFGGVLFIAGWAALTTGIYRINIPENK